MQRDYFDRYNRIINESGRAKTFHNIKQYQWDYNDELAIESNEALLGRGVVDLYKHVNSTRTKELYKYKNAVYRLTDDKSSFVVVEEPF